MKLSLCSLGILREIDETFHVHTSPYGGIREDYDDSNFVYLVPCICNENRAQQLPPCVDRRIRGKKRKRGVSTFELFFFWKKQRRFECYNEGAAIIFGEIFESSIAGYPRLSSSFDNRPRYAPTVKSSSSVKGVDY